MGIISILYFVSLLAFGLQTTGAQHIGVCYGRNGDNLPPEEQVVSLYKQKGITHMRVYDPVPQVLEALKNSDIQVIIDVPDFQPLTDPSAAAAWLKTTVLSYYPAVRIKYISVGNEVTPDSPLAADVLPAIQNIYNSLAEVGLQNAIQVSTSTFSALLANSYPPSETVFRDDVHGFIAPILQFLAEKKYPLLVNLYPYFAYAGDTEHIPLPFALGDPSSPPNPVGYKNLFDAMLDGFYYASSKLGAWDIEVVVSETGWPSSGSEAATEENAASYYRNLIGHVKSSDGTPYKPGKGAEVYLFAMFDEDVKPGAETERHFGLFFPSQQPKYDLQF